MGAYQEARLGLSSRRLRLAGWGWAPCRKGQFLEQVGGEDRVSGASRFATCRHRFSHPAGKWWFRPADMLNRLFRYREDEDGGVYARSENAVTVTRPSSTGCRTPPTTS